MQIGLLIKIDPRHTPQRAARLAIANWANSPTHGKRGHLAAELHYNPADLPADLEIDGLSVLPDNGVAPGHIRVTTVDMIGDNELEAERRRFAALVARETRGAVFDGC